MSFIFKGTAVVRNATTQRCWLGSYKYLGRY